MNSLSVQFQNLSIWTVPVGILIFVVLFLSFRRNSEQDKATYFILLCLRIGVFISLMVLFVKPLISWQWTRQKRPTVFAFVDNSQSMAAHQKIVPDSLQNMIVNLEKIFRKRSVDLQILPFGLDVGKRIDDLSAIDFSYDGTNISSVLDYCQTDPDNVEPDAAIIISDGVSTSGEELVMLKSYPRLPIYTIGIGDSLKVMDPAVLDVSMPAQAGVGDSVLLEVRVLPLGYDDLTTVTLRENDRIIQRKNIPLTEKSLIHSINFTVIPESAGILNYSVSIDTTDDRNPMNNMKYAQMRVTDQRQNLIILQGQNSFDARFFRMVCTSIQEIEVSYITLFSDKWYWESGADPFRAQWDAVAIFGLPYNEINPRQFDRLRMKIIRDHPAIYVQLLPGMNIDQLNRLLPKPVVNTYRQNETGVLSTTTRINDAHQHHPVFLSLNSEKQLAMDWAALPPIGMPFAGLELAKEYIPVVVTDTQLPLPVVSLSDSGPARTVFVSGYDIWRWDLMTTDADNEYIYPKLLNSLVNWMTDTLSTSNMQFTLDKKVFNKGEIAEVSGIVTNVNGEIVPEGVLSGQMIDERNKTTEFLIQWNGTKYTGEIPLTEAGKYDITIEGKVGSVSIGTYRSSIEVRPNSVEFQVIRQNIEGLKKLSEMTGGQYSDSKHYREIPGQIDLRGKEITREYQQKLWRWPGIFILLLLSLTAEWILRRSRGYQ